MNRVLAHTGARYPIVQTPMGWIARTQLASAVSRAGGLRVIETSSGETEACQAAINKMKALNRPFGVNLPIRFLRDDAMLKFVCASGVKFVTTSAGSPLATARLCDPDGPYDCANDQPLPWGVRCHRPVTLENATSHMTDEAASADIGGVRAVGSEGFMLRAGQHNPS